MRETGQSELIGLILQIHLILNMDSYEEMNYRSIGFANGYVRHIKKKRNRTHEVVGLRMYMYGLEFNLPSCNNRF